MSGKGTAAQQSPFAAGMRVQTSIQGRPIAVGWGTNRIGGNLLWYGSFGQVNLATVAGKGGGGGGSKSGKGGPKQPNYKVAVAIALAEGPIVSVNKVWSGSAQYAAPAGVSISGFSTFVGDYAQTAWSYLSTNFPAQALNYRGIAYVAASVLSLGANPTLPQYSWEVSFGSRYNPGGGIVDANPKDVLTDLMSNADYGANPAITLGTLTQYSNYCVANGLFMSPVLEQQESFANILTKLFELTNSTCVWSAPGVLNVIPYGDVAVTGNSVTYTPALTPQYDLTDEDFISASGEAPIIGNRTDPADAVNQLLLECIDRSVDYNISQVEWKDQGAIDRYGLHPAGSVVQGRWITSPVVGAVVAQLLGRRKLYIRNTYKFKLPVQYSRLEAGDLVTLTETISGLSFQLARLTVVDYGSSDDETIQCEAEEVPVGTAAPAAYGSQSSSGAVIDMNAVPGSINAPVIFDAPGVLTAGGYEIWAAVSGSNVNWGGCQVWVSTDNATYSRAGAVYGPGRYGTLSNTFALGVDPDTVNTCPVDLTVSAGTLTSGTQADADLSNTATLVGDEIIAYQTATLTAANKYNLTTYLRRGVFNTPKLAHSTSERAIRLDDFLLKVPYNQSFVGKTIYLKFPSFNRWGGGAEDLSTVPAYAYTVLGPIGAPDNVLNFAASQNGNVAVFQWALLLAKNISGYEIRYNPSNAIDPTSWGNATPLTQVTKGTQITTAKLPPGSWTCLIKAVDTSGKYSLTPTAASIAMLNVNQVIAQSVEDPDWWGGAINFLRHPSGVLIPESTKQANQHTNVELFEQFVPYPIAQSQYDSPEVDATFDGTIRLHGDVISALGRGVVSGTANPTLYTAVRVNAGAYGSYVAWTIGAVLCRFFKMRVIQLSAVGCAFIQQFRPTADAPQADTAMTGVTIAPGGTTLTFNPQYHIVPNVQVTMAGGSTALIPVVTSVTKTGCIVNIRDNTNASVGGTVNIVVTGA